MGNGEKGFQLPLLVLCMQAPGSLHLESLLVQQPQTNSATMTPCCTFVQVGSSNRLFLAETN